MKEFVYKNIHTAFIIDDNFKSCIIAKMLNSKYVFRLKKNSKIPQDEELMNLFQKLTHKKLINFTPKFKTNNSNSAKTENVQKLEQESV